LGSPDRVAPKRTITGHATAQTFACALVAQPRAGGGTRLEARLEAGGGIQGSAGDGSIQGIIQGG